MSTKKDLVIEGLEKLIELIEQSGDLREEVYFPIHDAMAQSGKLLEDQIKQNLTDNDSVATGDLRGSVSSGEVQVTKDAIFVEVGAGRGLPYAQAVEYGSKPHTPPLSITEPGQPLYEWVRIKQLAGIYSVRTGRRLGSKAKQIDENRRVARAIWAHIRRFGTKPHPYFEPALEQTKEQIMRLFQEAVEQVVQNVLRK
ncbi:MAG: HK97 gp10 family phage protein [Anaerolineae bacterium]|nr:HK97 gp10 family phage protein [Anaerolineae bacterium]